MTERPKHVPRKIPGPQSTSAQVAERRLHSRYPFTATATVIEVCSQNRILARVSDLGVGGCYVDTICPLPIGTAVTVQLENDDYKFAAAATVSYAHLGLGMGLAFRDIAPGDQSILASWIALASGQSTGAALSSTPAAPSTANASAAEPGPDKPSEVLKLRQILNELVSLMVRKQLIDAKEGANLLQQIML